MKLIYVVVLLLMVLSCNSNQIKKEIITTICADTISFVEEEILPEFKPFDRSKIRQKLQSKINNNEPLVVHVLVPLCDNIHQGIVPTTKSLGDGFNLKSNLYWATSKGIKRYFKERSDWKMLKSEIFSPDSVVLERVVYQKIFATGTKVTLIADAYRGDKIENCLTDFFNALAGKLTDTVFVSQDTILTHSKADLVAYNGHNGLMDVWVDDIYNADGIQKDAVVIACSSTYSFTEKLNYVQAYPLVTTTNSLYPGAFILEAIINNWATQQSELTIQKGAGDAYNRVKKCGLKSARNLFTTGW